MKLIKQKQLLNPRNTLKSKYLNNSLLGSSGIDRNTVEVNGNNMPLDDSIIEEYDEEDEDAMRKPSANFNLLLKPEHTSSPNLSSANLNQQMNVS